MNREATDLNRLLDVIKQRRRRVMLYYLLDNETITLEEAVTLIAAGEEKSEPDGVPDAVRDQINVALYHVHLPKLASLDAVDYDRRSETIRCRNPKTILRDILALTRPLDESTEE